MAGESALLLLLLQQQLSNGTIASTYCENDWKRRLVIRVTRTKCNHQERGGDCFHYFALDFFHSTATQELVINFVAQASTPPPSQHNLPSTNHDAPTPTPSNLLHIDQQQQSSPRIITSIDSPPQRPNRCCNWCRWWH